MERMKANKEIRNETDNMNVESTQFAKFVFAWKCLTWLKQNRWSSKIVIEAIDFLVAPSVRP